ncbi:acyl-CoA dehydrogenase family protein [Bradyrhizobium sp. CCGUVB23]|uniref:acyl-CoA dehydrogenase family protein n=1 Tax=Bradyrhizobium sp. CCGUVB23 TaxID=2949630 RepID=UPI0020B3C01E|nr:acyl-CoA dehydrogenase family protein [Bradyrhizobium sp. CCGUVB23]MCP3465718.1 acyl-CoA/acyl-ACP dehydrogenase [Bradyrhizobium sp. CCGUVB23]
MPELMLDDPDGTLVMLRDSVTGFAARFPGAKAMRERRGRGGTMDPLIWSAMAEAGWIGLLLPEECGGVGLGLREQAVLSEALGRALIAEPTGTASVFAATLLGGASPGAERSRLAAGVASGEMVAVPAWTSGAKPVVARSVNGSSALSGETRFVDAARAATDFLVVAQDADGVVLLSVAADADGVTISERVGVDGSALATISFSDCAVPADRVLSRANRSEELLRQAILHTRLALAAELTGLASKALELTIAYTSDRVQFGKPIGSFQAIQHRLVDMWIEAEFAAAAVVNAVDSLQADDVDTAELAVLAAKARAGEAAFSICRRAVHLHGAMGYTDECDIGLYLKRAINLNAMLGQPEQLRLEFVERESGYRRGRT